MCSAGITNLRLRIPYRDTLLVLDFDQISFQQQEYSVWADLSLKGLVCWV